jgi:metal-responsive CopG/Arc/MetJ family transcriptional regulator
MKSRKPRISASTTLERVTITLPKELFAWGEEERRRRHQSRSQFIASMLRLQHDELERSRRLDRYRAAYSAMPSTPEEDAVTEASTRLLLSDREA